MQPFNPHALYGPGPHRVYETSWAAEENCPEGWTVYFVHDPYVVAERDEKGYPTRAASECCRYIPAISEAHAREWYRAWKDQTGPYKEDINEGHAELMSYAEELDDSVNWLASLAVRVVTEQEAHPFIPGWSDRVVTTE